jgi:c-di-GMP-binding flagellar brake protein YcgR
VQSLKSQSNELLKVWDKVTLYVGDEDAQGEYEARIEDFIAGGIIITRPVFVSGQTLLRNGISVEVCFTREDATYQFVSKIQRQDFQGRQQTLLSPPRRIKRVQRRRFVRIDCSSRASYAQVTPMLDWENWKDRLKWTKSFCVNISAGGAMIRTDSRPEEGIPLLLRLALFEKWELPEIVAVVCRRHEKRDANWFAGVEFILDDRLDKHLDKNLLLRLPESISSFNIKVQNRLVTRIFNEQIAMRRKGIL